MLFIFRYSLWKTLGSYYNLDQFILFSYTRRIHMYVFNIPAIFTLF